MASDRTFPGTGLPLSLYAAVVLAAVALFVFFDGPLWQAPREASHLRRFLVSYLAVLPLATLGLLWVRRLSGEHLVASVATAWSIKLVITAVLYQVMARGVSANYQPVIAEPLPSALLDASYQAATGPFAGGSIQGIVREGGRPVDGAVAWVDPPAPGRPGALVEELALTIEEARYPEALALVGSSTRLRVRNRDPRLHTAHLFREGRAVSNRPLPAGAELTLSLPAPGIYQLRCDNHPREATWLVAVDHPYAAVSDAAGAFALDEIPAGAATLHAVAVRSGALSQAIQPLRVEPHHTIQIQVELGGRDLALPSRTHQIEAIR